jgi:very-short-patch-repair endonuclease
MCKWPTQAEALLWDELRGRKLAGYNYRRQHPIGSFIVDFYCPARKMVIEIDGPIHDKQKEEDEIREAYLKSSGYKVLRLDSQQVEKHLIDVLSEILMANIDSKKLKYCLIFVHFKIIQSL